MKYLKYFENDSDYKVFIESDEVMRPNISYSGDIKKVYYNPIEKPINNINVSVIRVMATPDSLPAVVFESEYPVASELTLSCKCSISDGGNAFDMVISATIPHNETSGVYYFKLGDVSTLSTITNITECKCTPERDSEYKYEMILNI